MRRLTTSCEDRLCLYGPCVAGAAGLPDRFGGRERRWSFVVGGGPPQGGGGGPDLCEGVGVVKR